MPLQPHHLCLAFERVIHRRLYEGEQPLFLRRDESYFDSLTITFFNQINFAHEIFVLML